MQEQKALLKEQDGELESLGRVCNARRRQLHDEGAPEQTVILEDLESDVDRTDSMMQNMSKKMKQLANDAKIGPSAVVYHCLLADTARVQIMVLS